MVRNRARRTDRGPSQDSIEASAKLVLEQDFSIRAAARVHNVCHVTLKRFIDKKKKNINAVMGYKPHNKVFTAEMETELTKYIKKCAGIFYGLTPKEVKQFAFQYAVRNNCKIPEKWVDNQMAGRDWFTEFLKRNPTLAIRSPESTSLSRAMNFNRENVGAFFENLSKVMDDYRFEPQDIYNVDETGINTAPSPGKIVAQKGSKQVGGINSHERGTLITMCLAVNAIGNSLPPMFIFPRKNFHYHFVANGPSGCIGAANGSGWMQTQEFLQFLEHFKKFTRPSHEKKVLLIADNHDSHIQIEVIDFCRENGIVLLSFPPHTSHKLQPLDRTVFGPFKKFFGNAADDWRKNNPRERMNIYHLPGLAAKALPLAVMPNNINNGFKCTGIYPFDRQVFTDEDYLPSSVTDQPTSTSTETIPGNTEPDTEDIQVHPNLDVAPVDEEAQHPSSFGETEFNQPISPKPSTSSGLIVSPDAIRPLPHAKPRMTKSGLNRRIKKSSIWTSSPVKEKLQKDKEIKEQNKTQKRKQVTKKQLKNKKKKPNCNSVESDDDSCFCIVCTEQWSQSKSKEKWIKCTMCESWAHEACTKGDLYYVCHNCDSE